VSDSALVLALKAVAFTGIMNLFVSVNGAMASTQRLTAHEVLSWFSPGIQSISVTNGPFTLPVANNVLKLSASETIPLLAVVPLTELTSQKFYPVIAGREISLAVEALGPYPKGQDPAILSKGLHVAIFDEKLKWEELLKGLKARAASVSEYDGLQVFNYSEPVDYTQAANGPQIELHVCSPKPAVLMISTDLTELHNTVNRMRQETPVQVALPLTLPEWKYVDESATFWALRHYQRSSNDPTLPQDQSAIGLTVSYHPSRGHVAVAYLSDNTKSNFLRSYAETVGLPIEVKTISPGVFLGTFESKQLSTFLSPVSWLLGHVIPGVL
jgi:hypothetical protein